MNKPNVTKFERFAEITLAKYERYIPTAFDESLTLLEKMNKLIQYLNEIGLLVNDVVDNWNKVMEWVMNDGLSQAISDKLDEMVDDGTLEEIINHDIFNALNNKVDNLNDELDKVIYKTGKGLNDISENETLQEFINTHNGKRIIIPPTEKIQINDELIIPDNTEIYGYKSEIIFENDTSYLTLSNNTCIKGITFINNSNNFNTSIKAININGEHQNYVKNICIEDCKFFNIGGFGIYMEYVENVRINKCFFDTIGYAGIHGFSVSNVNVQDTHIKNVIGVSSTHNCYGMAFSRRGNTKDLTVYPRSKNINVSNCLIENVEAWEGLDSHAGENINFTNNIIKNCGRGIALVSSHLNGVTDYATINSKISGNTIYGNGNNAGIVVTGGSNELSKGVIISNNTLIDSGEMGNNITGAIRLSYSTGLNVLGNTLINPLELGINLYQYNDQFNVSNNIIIDVHSKSWTAASYISLRGKENNGIILNNSLLRQNTNIDTYVGDRGVFIVDDNNNAKIEFNTDESLKGIVGVYESSDNQLKALEKSEIVEEAVDQGYTVQFKNGLTFTWKTVTLNPKDTTIQNIPFPPNTITSGHVAGSFSLVTHSAGDVHDYKLITLSSGLNGWNVKFDEGGIKDEIQLRLFAAGMTFNQE